MKKCSICGKEFKPYHSRQKTCGDAECKRLHRLAYSKQWAKEHPDMMREYNRLYMRKYRNSLKDYEAEKAKSGEAGLQSRRICRASDGEIT
jgi:hypothetical protein